MALSRMYLGRHFLGDVIGGVRRTGHNRHRVWGSEARAPRPRIAQASPLARASHHGYRIVLAGGALLVGLPDAGDAGRLLGTAMGALYLVGHDVFEREMSVLARVVLLIVAAAGFAAAWAVMSAALEQASPDSVSALRLAASALPNAALLIVPALVPRVLRVVRGAYAGVDVARALVHA